jgi:hypothetical protein
MKRMVRLFTVAVCVGLAVGGCGPSATAVVPPVTEPAATTAAPPSPIPTDIPAGVTITVKRAEDSGPGTLRQALSDAQAGDKIVFYPRLFSPEDPATIHIASALPEIGQGYLTIDGSDSGVILDGSDISPGSDASGLSISSQWNIVRGLQIIHFPGAGISLGSGSDHNIIGGDMSIGMGPLGEGNVISLNGAMGIAMYQASHNLIQGNFVGTDQTGSEPWGNQSEGIYIEDGSHNQVLRNVVGDNEANGITLHGAGAQYNVLQGNLIGTDASARFPVANRGNGVEIRNGAANNDIGADNTIANNRANGVQLYGAASNLNVVTGNSIHDNGWAGIDLWGGANAELAPPVVYKFDLNSGSMEGLAYPNAQVEIFSGDDNEGRVFEGKIAVDDSGWFVLEKGAPFVGPHLTATATAAGIGTSEFSLPTAGDQGSTTLQAGSSLRPARLVALKSDELADNRIASFWHSLWGYEPLSELLDEASYMGVKRFRFAINGGEAEHVDWSKSEFIIDPAHDQFISDLAAMGIQMTYNLSFWDTATWPDGAGAPCPRFKTEEDIQHYLEYVRFVVGHFKDRVQTYEIWNEPDNTMCPQRVDPADYVELTRRAVPVIRDEYPKAKIQVGGTAGLSNPESREYLFQIINTDVMPMVDVISWHPLYGDSPEQNSDFYYAYPATVEKLKEAAAARGFAGEYEADEMNWRPLSEPEEIAGRKSYGETAYAKYWARGILMNLGMDVTAGNLRIPHQWVAASYVLRNISTIMPGNHAEDLSATIESEAPRLASFGYSLDKGDYILAVWSDDVATDYDSGVASTVVVPGFAGWNATGIDVLSGFEQQLTADEDNGDLIIRDLMVKDYPVLIRLSN